jgi:hypothetical protein
MALQPAAAVLALAAALAPAVEAADRSPKPNIPLMPIGRDGKPVAVNST